MHKTTRCRTSILAWVIFLGSSNMFDLISFPSFHPSNTLYFKFFGLNLFHGPNNVINYIVHKKKSFHFFIKLLQPSFLNSLSQIASRHVGASFSTVKPCICISSLIHNKHNITWVWNTHNIEHVWFTNMVYEQLMKWRDGNLFTFEAKLSHCSTQKCQKKNLKSFHDVPNEYHQDLTTSKLHLLHQVFWNSCSCYNFPFVLPKIVAFHINNTLSN
jgi:hypothetical protein